MDDHLLDLRGGQGAYDVVAQLVYSLDVLLGRLFVGECALFDSLVEGVYGLSAGFHFNISDLQLEQ